MKTSDPTKEACVLCNTPEDENHKPDCSVLKRLDLSFSLDRERWTYGYIEVPKRLRQNAVQNNLERSLKL